MNVLAITSTFPRWAGDSGSPFVYELCQRLYREGLNIVVLAPHAHGAKKSEIMDGVRVYRHQYLLDGFQTLTYDGGILSKLRANKLNYLQIPFFLLSQLLAIRKIVKRENIDVLHAHWIIPQGLAAVIYKKIFNKNIKIVCTSHGSDILALKNHFFIQLKKFVLKNVDILTVVSSHIKDEALKLSPATSCEIVSMGVDFQNFSPDKRSDQIRQVHNITGPFLLFVGRLSSEKGIEYLIAAMPQVVREFPAAKLLIIGFGPLQEELKGAVDKLNLSKNIIFLAYLNPPELAKYYATADIFIGPSLQEGFGLVFVEALGCGCSVIASDLPAISDIIQNNKTGLVARPKSSEDLARKILTLIKNRDLRETLKENGRNYVLAKFDWKNILPKYLNLLKMS